MEIKIPNQNDTTRNSLRQIASAVRVISSSKKMQMTDLLQAIQEVANLTNDNAIIELISKKQEKFLKIRYNKKDRIHQAGYEKDNSAEILTYIAECIKNYAIANNQSIETTINEIKNR